MSAGHTPLPWDVDGTYLMGRSEDGRLMAIADCARSVHSSIPLGKANAAFIGLAVNSHGDMLDALKEAKSLATTMAGLTACRSDDEWVWGIQAKIDAAIAKAEGTSLSLSDNAKPTKETEE